MNTSPNRALPPPLSRICGVMILALEGVPDAAGKAKPYWSKPAGVQGAERGLTYATVLTMRAVHMPPNPTAS